MTMMVRIVQRNRSSYPSTNIPTHTQKQEKKRNKEKFMPPTLPMEKNYEVINLHVLIAK